MISQNAHILAVCGSPGLTPHHLGGSKGTIVVILHDTASLGYMRPYYHDVYL